MINNKRSIECVRCKNSIFEDCECVDPTLQDSGSDPQ